MTRSAPGSRAATSRALPVAFATAYSAADLKDALSRFSSKVLTFTEKGSFMRVRISLRRGDDDASTIFFVLSRSACSRIIVPALEGGRVKWVAGAAHTEVRRPVWSANFDAHAVSGRDPKSEPQTRQKSVFHIGGTVLAAALTSRAQVELSTWTASCLSSTTCVSVTHGQYP
jgi:hypothetical protein